LLRARSTGIPDAIYRIKLTSGLENFNGTFKADLHTHTYYSDGYHTPEELILKAKEAGISHLALPIDNVDHESLIAIGKSMA
jgi:hypothetical protein